MPNEEVPTETTTLRRSDEEPHVRTMIIRRSPEKRVRIAQWRNNIDRTLAAVIAVGAIVVISIAGYARYEDNQLISEYDGLPRTNIVAQSGDTYNRISASLVSTEKFHQELRQDWGMRKYGDLSLKIGETREYPCDPAYLEKKSQRAR